MERHAPRRLSSAVGAPPATCPPRPSSGTKHCGFFLDGTQRIWQARLDAASIRLCPCSACPAPIRLCPRSACPAPGAAANHSPLADVDSGSTIPTSRPLARTGARLSSAASPSRTSPRTCSTWSNPLSCARRERGVASPQVAVVLPRGCDAHLCPPPARIFTSPINACARVPPPPCRLRLLPSSAAAPLTLSAAWGYRRCLHCLLVAGRSSACPLLSRGG